MTCHGWDLMSWPFLNPWKPDSPCLSGFLPHDLIIGRVLCVGSRHKICPDISFLCLVLLFLPFPSSTFIPSSIPSHLHCYCPVAKSCLTLCDPMDCSTPGFPVLHNLLEFAQTHVHRVGDTIQPSHPLSPLFSSCPQSFPASGSSLMSQLFASGGQSVGASASASVPPMNTQGWFPLGLAGLISLLSKGLSQESSRAYIHTRLLIILWICNALCIFMVPLLTSWHCTSPSQRPDNN